MSTYTNDAQQRILNLVLAMFGDVVNGFTPTQLCKSTGATPSSMTRDLANLQEAGLAERNEETGLWRLTPRLPQQAIKVFHAIDAADRRVQEAKQRFTRTPI